MKKMMSLILITVMLLGLFCLPAEAAKAKEPETLEMYVICQPWDYVHIRTKPNRKSMSEGYLLPGDKVTVTGKKKNGFLYSDTVVNEPGEGWIHAGYLVEDEPLYMEERIYIIKSRGRVAARKYIGGPRRCWLKNGDKVMVRYYSEEWCVTNRGFIMTKYLMERTK